MKIGIDISQLAYKNTGVAEYLRNLIKYLTAIDKENEYILFYSSLRRNFQFSIFNFPHKETNFSKVSQSNHNVSIKRFKIPPTLLDFLWNKLHILPVEWLIGDVDLFITSDWTEPPSLRAKKLTILYDLIVFKYPEETDKKIISIQKRKLAWAKKESSAFLCISESTKKDAKEILGIDEKKLFVIYPGV